MAPSKTVSGPAGGANRLVVNLYSSVFPARFPAKMIAARRHIPRGLLFHEKSAENPETDFAEAATNVWNVRTTDLDALQMLRTVRTAAFGKPRRSDV